MLPHVRRGNAQPFGERRRLPRRLVRVRSRLGSVLGLGLGVGSVLGLGLGVGSGLGLGLVSAPTAPLHSVAWRVTPPPQAPPCERPGARRGGRADPWRWRPAARARAPRCGRRHRRSSPRLRQSRRTRTRGNSIPIPVRMPVPIQRQYQCQCQCQYLACGGWVEHARGDDRRDVVHVREAARLLAVAEDGEGLGAQHLVHEDAHRVAKLVGDVLPRAVDVVRSEDGEGQPEHPARRAQVQLEGVLGDAVRVLRPLRRGLSHGQL
eukprot:scaffold91375_cov60-Phaeocystis_antarctica.AAC.3